MKFNHNHPNRLSLHPASALAIIAILLGAPVGAPALTITSGPLFSPSSNAPLAGLLQLSTEVDSRVSVFVSNGTDFWEKDFFDFSTNHALILAGFKPNQTNQMLVTAYDKAGNPAAAGQPLSFVTAPLPPDFPTYTVLTNNPNQMEPGYTLFIIQAFGSSSGGHYMTMMDNTGAVVWYMPWTSNDSDVRQLDNGDLFIEEQAIAAQGTPGDFLEINLLGQTVRTWTAPAAYPVNPHEGVVTDHGTFLYLSDVSQVVSNFPTSDVISNPPLATVTVDDNPVVEISATNGALLNAWSPLSILDPTRVTYLTYGFYNAHGVDSEHANAVIESPNDNCLIASQRDQNAVYKFSRATGALKWILGPPQNWGPAWQPYLLTPVGAPFEWNYGQHAPMLTPQGTLLVYDDGNERACPLDPPIADQDNYSRGVEYSINETNMTVSQVWDSSAAAEDRLFTAIVGKTQWLPQRRNVLVTYGYVSYINGAHPSAFSPNATMVRIIEYTHDPVPQVVFDLSFFDYTNTSSTYSGYFCYRSERVPDLYAHPALPVVNLALNTAGQVPALSFSADPARSYVIQASSDLQNWTNIGAPIQEEANGQFYFEDLNADQVATRFYRVLTQ